MSDTAAYLAEQAAFEAWMIQTDVERFRLGKHMLAQPRYVDRDVQLVWEGWWARANQQEKPPP